MLKALIFSNYTVDATGPPSPTVDEEKASLFVMKLHGRFMRKQAWVHGKPQNLMYQSIV